MRQPGKQDELVDALARTAAGDRSAFALLYRRTAPKLLATVARILPGRQAAEDAVQEAFVNVWRKAAGFDPAIASPIAWMTTIARHAAIDVVRRGSERVSAAGEAIDADMENRLAAPEAGADALSSRQLGICIGELEREPRAMVVLAYSHGWSRQELADRFDRPVATVKTILRRALIALKECLGGVD